MLKKLLVAVTTLLVSATSYSQETKMNNGFRRGGGGNPHMKEELKRRIVDQLKVTEPQADSIVAAQLEFQRSRREIEQNTNLSDKDKESKLAEMKTARKTKLQTLLNDAQMETLQTMMENMRKEREQRKETKQESTKQD